MSARRGVRLFVTILAVFTSILMSPVRPTRPGPQQLCPTPVNVSHKVTFNVLPRKKKLLQITLLIP